MAPAARHQRWIYAMDPEELAEVASDRVALLDKGHMHFQGTPAEFIASTDPVVTSFRDSAAALGTTLAELRRGADIHSED